VVGIRALMISNFAGQIRFL